MWNWKITAIIFKINYTNSQLYKYPLLIDLGCYSMKKIRNLTFQERGEKFVDFYTKIKKVIFINSIYNAEKKYYLYKLKFTSSFDVNRKFICYYLFGEKNNFSYYLALYFFDEENDEQHNQFLINTYNNN